jgi:hypothetical protein
MFGSANLEPLFVCQACGSPLAERRARSDDANSEIVGFLPDRSCAVSQRGCFPRPAQVSDGSAGFLYLGKTCGKDAVHVEISLRCTLDWSASGAPQVGFFRQISGLLDGSDFQVQSPKLVDGHRFKIVGFNVHIRVHSKGLELPD